MKSTNGGFGIIVGLSLSLLWWSLLMYFNPIVVIIVTMVIAIIVATRYRDKDNRK